MAPAPATLSSPSTEHFRTISAWARGRGSQLLCKCAALIVLCFATAATASAQLVVTSGGVPVNQGDALWMTTVPSMPDIVFSVNGGTSCDYVSYSLYVEYTDQAGSPTSITYVAQNEPGDQSVPLDSGGILSGGVATVTWQFDGIDESSTANFVINGTNPPNSAVDAYASSGPWFVLNLIAWESRAWSLSPTGQYKQFDSFGNPLWGSPDGIGLMQLEPPNRASVDQDFWSWPDNVADGLHLLSTTQAGAYSHWNTQIGNSQTDGGPNPPAFYGTHCAFQYPQNGGDYYGDADWIHSYNSYYYTLWVRPSGGNPGYWNMDGYNNSGYVQSVCNSDAL